MPIYKISVQLRRDHLADLADALRRVQPFRAGRDTVHDAVAAPQLPLVVQRAQPLLARPVARVHQPPVRLVQHRRPQVLVRVPPVARARSAAARAQDTLVQPVQPLPLLRRLQLLCLGFGRFMGSFWYIAADISGSCFRRFNEVRADGFVLCVEIGEVDDEIPNDW